MYCIRIGTGVCLQFPSEKYCWPNTSLDAFCNPISNSNFDILYPLVFIDLTPDFKRFPLVGNADRKWENKALKISFTEKESDSFESFDTFRTYACMVGFKGGKMIIRSWHKKPKN